MSHRGFPFTGLTNNVEKLVTTVLLISLVVGSALAVIYSTYKSRQLFSALQREYRHEIELEEQWGRLLLEQSTWASPVRIEEVAKTRLGMKVPDPSSMRIVR